MALLDYISISQFKGNEQTEELMKGEKKTQTPLVFWLFHLSANSIEKVFCTKQVLKTIFMGTSLVVKQLRLHASKGLGFHPRSGPHATWCSQKKIMYVKYLTSPIVSCNL